MVRPLDILAFHAYSLDLGFAGSTLILFISFRNRVVQFLARREAHTALRRHLNFGAGLGIHTSARGRRRHHKRPETY
jgi:hypothetical protein